MTITEDRPVERARARIRSVAAKAAPPRREIAPSRLTGLDGLRAVAVAAVVLFHLDPELVPGGFLGVDVFFVISGFLITRLLLLELTKTGTVRLGRFYRRRARRLFPAVAALLIAVVVAAVCFWRDELPTLGGSVLSSLSYVTNWWLIFDHQSYFVSSGRPPMLQHLWSLAIEEQYYLLWSLLIVLLAGPSWTRRKGHAEQSGAERVRRVAVAAIALSAASTLAMAIIAIRTNVPFVSDSSRVYFGTDTHSMGLLLGSAAGAWNVLRAHQHTGRAFAVPGWLTDALAVIGLLVLGWEFRHLTEYAPGLYRGGFLALDAVTLVVVCAVVRTGSAAGRVLDLQPMRWLGERSYSIYLWHWPVVVVTRPGVDLHGSVLLIDVARLGLILTLSAVSYRYVESPLRQGTWRKATGRIPRVGPRLILTAAVALTSAATLALMATPVRAVNTSRPVAFVPLSPPGSAIRALSPLTPPATTLTPPVLPAVPSAAAHVSPHQPVTAPAPHRPPVGVASQVSISAFGDSVLLGADTALTRLDPNVRVDAIEGRQAYSVLDDIVADHKNGTLGPVVVIHTGNNGIINPAQLTSTLSTLRDRARVIVLTDRVPRDWQAPNNHTLTSVSSQFANVTVLNWNTLSAPNHGWFYGDGIHLNPTGAAEYAHLIMSAAAR